METFEVIQNFISSKKLIIGILTILILNFYILFVYFLDKKKAIKSKRRISENHLLISSFFAPFGAIIGMQIFRHKTKKLKFRILIQLFLCLQLILALLLLLKFELYN